MATYHKQPVSVRLEVWNDDEYERTYFRSFPGPYRLQGMTWSDVVMETLGKETPPSTAARHTEISLNQYKHTRKWYHPVPSFTFADMDGLIAIRPDSPADLVTKCRNLDIILSGNR